MEIQILILADTEVQMQRTTGFRPSQHRVFHWCQNWASIKLRMLAIFLISPLLKWTVG